MKRRFLATLMAVFMVVGMVGCGNAGASEQYGNDATPPPSFIAPSSSVEDVPSYDESDNVDDSIEEEKVEEAEHESLYIMTILHAIYYRDYNVYRLDLANSDFEQVSYFHFVYDQYSSAEFELMHNGRYYDNIQLSPIMLSPDFTKFAGISTLVSGETHAGWMNADGTFFDVTQTLGEGSKSEFEAPKHFIALGFIDGKFVYWDKDNDATYYINVDDPNVSFAGNPIKDEFGDSLDFKFTDWLGEDRLLGSIGWQGAIFNADDYETYEIILPADTPRDSWGFVSSPDCESVAFFSAYDGIRDLALYTTRLDDISPVRIDLTGELDLSEYQVGFITLLDWR